MHFLFKLGSLLLIFWQEIFDGYPVSSTTLTDPAGWTQRRPVKSSQMSSHPSGARRERVLRPPVVSQPKKAARTSKARGSQDRETSTDPPAKGGKPETVVGYTALQGGFQSGQCSEVCPNNQAWERPRGQPGEHVLTNKTVVDGIVRIKRKRVLACVMAPVCTSFSVARDRAKMIRNRCFPWGVPFCQLSDKEAASVRLGNACFRSCLLLKL